MIMILAFFLVFVTGFIVAGSKANWNHAKAVIDQTEREGHAPNYHYIAQTERAIWGEAFHSDGAKLCECNMCLENRTPKYLGSTDHVAIAARAYGYGYYDTSDIVEDGYNYAPEDEWRDRNAE